MSGLVVRRLDDNGDPCYGHGPSDFVRDADAVVVLVTMAVSLTMGEWFLDTTLGPAWAHQDGQQIMGAMPADLAFMRSELVRVVAACPGVDSIIRADMDFDARTRVVSATVEILTVFGQPRTITYTRAS